MVTGATGFVASWVIYELLKKGVPVHAAVRNPDDKTKTAHLDKLAAETKGTICYFKADLLQEGSYQEAMKGCELVFHTASPFTTNVKDP
ncbi:NAD(P)H-binding protein [Siphonobacter sp. SORGH_AS_0500]|uniref:NAD(P)H-binding protein n=1 Tax=Siphonobacter sp. SORGH_AS_0500 TaxID=1864824 RepID=UPI00286A51D3|nr:NAD(P)H-binding protein [Siphonobacter sp. SORGH_AS_0500]